MPTRKDMTLIAIRGACMMFFALAGALNASSIGVAVNGTCEVGSCPATPLAFNSTGSLTPDFTITLPDTDTYLIYGSFTDSNNSDGSGFAAGHDFQVVYEGNAVGGPSAADTVTVQAYYAFQAAVASTTFSRGLIGAFGPTIAPASSASSCVNGTLACLGPVTPPGSFSLATSVLLTSSGGAFTWDPAYTGSFGAGSAVGSYIVWGQTTPLAAPTPEPAPLTLLAFTLAGWIVARRKIVYAIGFGR